MTVSFNTNPINNGTQYQITDMSTNPSIYQTDKRVIIKGADGTTLEDNNYLLSQSPIIINVNQSNWSAHLGLLQIQVSLIYNESTGGSDSVTQLYLLPTSLNIKQ